MNFENKPTSDQIRKYKLEKRTSLFWLAVGLVTTVVIFYCGHFEGGCIALFITIVMYGIDADTNEDSGEFPPDSSC